MLIEFLVQIRCNGCRAVFHARAHENPEALAEIGANLLLWAREEGWTPDRDAIWCPLCVRQRGAPVDSEAEADHQALLEGIDRRYWAELLERTPAAGGVQ